MTAESSTNTQAEELILAPARSVRDSFREFVLYVGGLADLGYQTIRQTFRRPFETRIFLNHLDQIGEQLTRKPYPLPKLAIKRKPESIFAYRFEDFEIVGYQSHPHIAMPVAV